MYFCWLAEGYYEVLRCSIIVVSLLKEVSYLRGVLATVTRFQCIHLLQEDDGLPSEPPTAKPFLPDDDEPHGGGGAGPLPQKEEPRYVHTPGQSRPPPPSHQVSVDIRTEPVS